MDGAVQIVGCPLSVSGLFSQNILVNLSLKIVFQIQRKGNQKQEKQMDSG